MKISCIPLSAKKPSGDYSTGTGFLVKRVDGPVRLITAAHVPAGENFADFSIWPKTMHVHLPDGSSVPVDLFATVAGKQGPIFEHFRTHSGGISDFISLRILDGIASSKGPLGRYQIHSTKFAHIRPVEGHAIVIQGYPNWTASPTLKPGTPVVKPGKYLKYNDAGFHEALIAAEPGHSGGPAMTAGGKLLGLIIGQTDGKDRIISAGLINDLIAP